MDELRIDAVVPMRTAILTTTLSERLIRRAQNDRTILDQIVAEVTDRLRAEIRNFV